MFSKKEVVSVIVPVYNSERYLSECIDSILGQSYTNLEIILIDDGSKDSSRIICESYLNKDSRIVFHSQKNKGVSSARNKGLSVAKGEYILFVDSDDVIHPNHIESMCDSILDADICFSDYIKIYDRKEIRWLQEKKLINKKSLVSKEKALISMVYRNPIGWEVCSKLYKNSLINGIYFDENESLGEDFSFAYKAVHRADKVSFCQNSSYFYYSHPNSATKQKYSEKDKALIKTAENFKYFIQRNYKKLNKLYSVFYVHACLENLDKLYTSDEKNVNDIKEIRWLLSKYIFKVIMDGKVCSLYKIKVFLIFFFPSLYLKIKNVKREMRK